MRERVKEYLNKQFVEDCEEDEIVNENFNAENDMEVVD